MYFLAILLTLRAKVPERLNISLENANESVLPLQITPGKDAYLPKGHMRAALLRRNQGLAQVRLTCCCRTGGSPGEAILQALTPGSVLQYAGQDCEVESVDLTDTLWTGVGTWPDMLSQPPGIRMRFTFATPLVTSDPDRGQVGNALPFPDPQTLFTSALRHWRLLDGPFLPYTGERMTQIARCVVSEYRLKTTEQIIADHSHLGFLGWIEYVCRTRETSVVASLNALARLTFFSGCGYLTERGMGVTSVTITN